MSCMTRPNDLYFIYISVCLMVFVFPPCLCAQGGGFGGQPPSGGWTGTTAGPAAMEANASLAILDDVGINQNIGKQIPLDLTFRDEKGNDVTLKELYRGKPVILTLVYYDCPMLCTDILNGLNRSLRPLSFSAGKEFDIITVSFDPRETPTLASEKKYQYVTSYGREGTTEGWRFLTGEPESIKALTDAVGFHYTYDDDAEQFAHGSSIMVTTPAGVVSHYFFGIEYPPSHLRLALIEASEDRLGSIYDQVALYCFHYDPKTGKYGMVIMNVIRLSGIATVVGMGAFMFIMIRRDRRKKGTSTTTEST